MTEIPEVGDWLQIAPWRDRAVSILHVSNGGDIVRQAHSLDDKRTLLQEAPVELIVLWTGKYRTDARGIRTVENLNLIAEAVSR